jgi:hypothetical protein
MSHLAALALMFLALILSQAATAHIHGQLSRRAQIAMWVGVVAMLALCLLYVLPEVRDNLRAARAALAS